MIPIGDLDAALRALENEITPAGFGVQAGQPVRFYLQPGEGGAELYRDKTPPYVIWEVRAGKPAERTYDTTEEGRRRFLDDGVEVVARCAGFTPPGQLTQESRRAQLGASLAVMDAVSWAVHSSLQGLLVRDEGWDVESAELSESCVVVNYTFVMRRGRLSPDLDTALVESVQSEVRREP